MNFDLVSDLHIDQWPSDQKLNFKGIGTSLTCIVAGDVSQDLQKTREFLYQLADNYSQVIFVDGNHEHKADYSKISEHCDWLEYQLSKKQNIMYLWDSSAIVGSTAIIGTNGWWSFDYLEPTISRLDQINGFCELEGYHTSTAIKIWDEAVENSEFLYNVVSDFNKVDAIKDIVIVTHTVPRKELIKPMIHHPMYSLPKLYNSHLQEVLYADVNQKINTWCFGHYHDIAWDETIEGIRYVSNPRGRPEDSLFPIYYPKLVALSEPNQVR